MSESPESSQHPALTYLRENAIIIGIVGILVASLIVIFVKQGAADQKVAAAPSVTATAGAATPQPTKPATPSSSATPSASASASPTSSPSAAPVKAKAAPTPTAEAVRTIGTQPQSVQIQDWRVFAEKFAVAYGNPAGGKEAWLARMRPLITDALYEGFEYTDIRKVEPLTLGSINKIVEENAYSTFTVNYKGKPEFMDALIQVQNDGTWKVHKLVDRQD